MTRVSGNGVRSLPHRWAAALLLGALAAAWIAGCRGEPDLTSGGQAFLAECAVCHGTEAAGDGPLAASIRAEGKPPPARLGHERVTALGEAGVREAIQTGVHLRGATMPVWGPHLGPAWIARIADYVVTSADSPARHASVEEYLESPRGTPRGSRRLYVLYCSGCHGPEGRGDGFLSPANARRLAVASLRVPEITRMNDRQLERLIGPGGSHAPDAETMPGWLHTLSPVDREALLGYVRSLAASH